MLVACLNTEISRFIFTYQGILASFITKKKAKNHVAQTMLHALNVSSF